MKYLIFIAIVLNFGCSVSKSNVEKKDLDIKTKSDRRTSIVDSTTTGSKAKSSAITIDNSITTIVEVKVDSTNKVVTTTTTNKKNDIVTGTSSEVEDFSNKYKVVKKDSTSSLTITDKGKIKSSVERSSYGIYGIVFCLTLLALLALKYYKKIISLFL